MMCALMGTVITFWPKVFFNQSIWHSPGVHPASALRPSVFSPQPIVRASAPASFYARTPGAKYRIFFLCQRSSGGNESSLHVPRLTCSPTPLDVAPRRPVTTTGSSSTQLHQAPVWMWKRVAIWLHSFVFENCRENKSGVIVAAAADEQLTPLLPFK